MRDSYEAYLIYNFLFLLIGLLGDETEIDNKLSQKPQAHHLFPFNYCLKPWRMQDQFLNNCKHGAHRGL